LCDPLPRVECLVEDKYPDEVGGVSVEFRLVYQGPLASGTEGRLKEKSAIRRCFHEQMAELWTQNAALRRLGVHGSGPDAGVNRLLPLANRKRLSASNYIYNFLPLIGEGHGISCSLDILFLRRESAGGVVKHGGDIDNRIKVLFDALRVPSNEELQDVPPAADESPFFCVLEDDKYIDEVKVTTDRLLLPMSTPSERSNVLLVIRAKTIIFDVEHAPMWVIA
jgi:hypothetical protein